MIAPAKKAFKNFKSQLLPQIINYILIAVVVLILTYNAYVKLNSDPGAIQLFTGLQIEPYGRLILGTVELLAAISLLFAGTVKYGAILTMVLMSGVIVIHLTRIGVALGGDYSFFLMGVVAFLGSLILIWKSYQKDDLRSKSAIN